MPALLNSLCPLLRYQIHLEESDHKLVLSYDKICEEIANTIASIAAFGIQDIKDQEASLEDKMMFGNETSPMQRLYEKGNRNLRGIA